MRIFRRRPIGTDANEIAMHAAKHTGSNRITAIGTAIALLFSAYSLWETSLKQADLSVYVTGVVTYERDLTAAEYLTPADGFEVLAVPVTIANSGARAPVLGLQLDASNPRTGLAARFEATYTADGAYFANTGDKRQTTPFSALVVAGRSAWTGTLLFYPVSYSNGKALTPVIKVRALNDALRKKYATEMGGSVSISVAPLLCPSHSCGVGCGGCRWQVGRSGSRLLRLRAPSVHLLALVESERHGLRARLRLEAGPAT